MKPSISTILGLAMVAGLNFSVAQAFSPTCPTGIEGCLNGMQQNSATNCELGQITTIGIPNSITLRLDHKAGTIEFINPLGVSDCSSLVDGIVLTRSDNEMQFAQCAASLMQHCTAVRK